MVKKAIVIGCGIAGIASDFRLKVKGYDVAIYKKNTYDYKGASHETISNSLLSAFLRHSNFSKTYKNLYFVGGSAHLEGGIPLCLLSAKIATENA